MTKLSFVLAAALASIFADSAVCKMGNMYKSISQTEDQRVRNIKAKIATEGTLSPQEKYFSATIDHFTNHGAGSEKYQMRYLVDDTYFDRENGPIIFYAGNEGDVYTFFDNSGFMTTTLAEQFGALVIFGEHRYYGTSMPFGDESFDKDNLKYLTVEQAMEDYVEFMYDYKRTNELMDRAVIVGGGSYGGMLSAWLRMKYPHVFQGALAASAPILFFDGYVSPDAYDDIATDDYRKAGGQACPDQIKAGFNQLDSLREQSEEYASIAKIFNLCAVPSGPAEVQSLISTLEDSLGTMAMVDYPYPTNFVEPLPAWPVTYACGVSNDAFTAAEGDANQALYAIAAAGTTFYNYAGQLQCLDVSVSQGGGLDDNGWGVQACNEMAMPFASGANSMFPTAAWDEKENSAYCNTLYGELPQYNWALDYFGGRNPERDFAKASNIIFSNGELDPWQAGGVTKKINDETIALYIMDSAHHTDLRLPNVADPQTLTDARQTETEWIAKWIDQYQGTNFSAKVANKTEEVEAVASGVEQLLQQ